MSNNVIVLGASNKPERYSNKAIKLLKEKGYIVLPVHPKLEEIDKTRVYSRLEDIKEEEINTLTLYVGSEISTQLEKSILELKTKRVIFNPGSENPDLANKLKAKGVEVLEACTLVMLSTGQF